MSTWHIFYFQSSFKNATNRKVLPISSSVEETTTKLHDVLKCKDYCYDKHWPLGFNGTMVIDLWEDPVLPISCNHRDFFLCLHSDDVYDFNRTGLFLIARIIWANGVLRTIPIKPNSLHDVLSSMDRLEKTQNIYVSEVTNILHNMLLDFLVFNKRSVRHEVLQKCAGSTNVVIVPLNNMILNDSWCDFRNEMRCDSSNKYKALRQIRDDNNNVKFTESKCECSEDTIFIVKISENHRYSNCPNASIIDENLPSDSDTMLMFETWPNKINYVLLKRKYYSELCLRAFYCLTPSTQRSSIAFESFTYLPRLLLCKRRIHNVHMYANTSELILGKDGDFLSINRFSFIGVDDKGFSLDDKLKDNCCHFSSYQQHHGRSFTNGNKPLSAEDKLTSTYRFISLKVMFS